MPFAVEMFLDKSAERRVREVWADLARATVNSFMIDGGYRPHVTLGVFEGYSSPDFEQEFRQFVGGLHPLSLRFDSVGIFLRPKCVVFFAPVVTAQLLSVHDEFTSRLTRFVTGASPLCPLGRWVPHCTLAFDTAHEAIPAAVEVCSRAPLSFTAQVTEIGLVEVPKHREVLVCELTGATSGSG
jgi:2'-5' RNA ligase